MIILILCAGKGIRATEVTGDTPKQLFPIPDRNALEYLLDYVEPLKGDVRVVVNPADRDKFARYSDYVLVEQPEPLGEANAVFHGLADRCHSSDSVFIMLGDNIPIGEGASEMRDMLVQGERSNLIATCMRNGASNTTIIKTKCAPEYVPQSSDVSEFIEVRGVTVQGECNTRSGFDYIRRADVIYRWLDWQNVQDIKSSGEYRLPTIYQYMISLEGERFATVPVDFLSVGDPDRIQKAIDYYG